MNRKMYLGFFWNRPKQFSSSAAVASAAGLMTAAPVAANAAAPGEWQLTDYVRKGIELLDNSNGFFRCV